MKQRQIPEDRSAAFIGESVVVTRPKDKGFGKDIEFTKRKKLSTTV